MKSTKYLSVVIIIFLVFTSSKSCKDDIPTYQEIRIVNDSHYPIEKVIIQSNNDYLSFQGILPDSTSAYEYGEDISSSLKFIVTINGIDIRIDWELPRYFSSAAKNKIFYSGEYKFSISHIDIDIDKTSNDNSIQIHLSEFSRRPN